MKLSLRIDVSDDTAPVVTVTGSEVFAGDKKALISFPLNFDSDNPTPQPKRRLAETDKVYAARCAAHSAISDAEPKPQRTEDESDEAFAIRCGGIYPAALDVPADFLVGLTERCREIMDTVRDHVAHYAVRAAAEQTLAAEGKAPPGVKQIKVGGSLVPKSHTRREKH